MRTLYPVTFIIGLAVAIMVIQMSGLPSILMGGDSVGMIRADDELSESVENTSMNTTGSPDASSNGGFFQFVTGGITKIIDFAEMVLILPETLTALPLFPWWLAYPLGIAGETVAIIGIAETVMNREWT